MLDRLKKHFSLTIGDVLDWIKSKISKGKKDGMFR